MANEIVADWIGVDWGTSSLRAWAMNAGNQVLARAQSKKGMAGLAPAEFEPALLELVSPWLGLARATRVICCGMVGARQGWLEAPYEEVPLKLDSSKPCRVKSEDARLDVHILPGLMQASPPDVMRGEETQIAGFLATQKNFTGVICLPGTHTKWASITDNTVKKFTTVMTGELFDLIAKKSVLRHSVAEEGWDKKAFAQAFQKAFATPQILTRTLFSIRAGSLLAGLSPQSARAELSGLLLGVEFNAARSYWQSQPSVQPTTLPIGGPIAQPIAQPIAIVGATGLSRIYRDAFDIVRANSVLLDVAKMTLMGLAAAHEEISRS